MWWKIHTHTHTSVIINYYSFVLVKVLWYLKRETWKMNSANQMKDSYDSRWAGNAVCERMRNRNMWFCGISIHMVCISPNPTKNLLRQNRSTQIQMKTESNPNSYYNMHYMLLGLLHAWIQTHAFVWGKASQIKDTDGDRFMTDNSVKHAASVNKWMWVGVI